MRETRVAGALVFSADVIPDLKIDHGDFVVLEQYHLKTVRERVSCEIKLWGTNRGRLLLRGKRQGETARRHPSREMSPQPLESIFSCSPSS